MSDIIYTFKNNAYFNITNRCTCKCIFCIRNEHEAIGEATELWHDHNPSFEEIKAAIDAFDFTNYPEAVFRVNTNGLGELFNKKPIAEEMAKYIDAVSISLNAPTAERYQEVTQPCFENAFPDMLAFAEKAKKLFSSVQFSVVSIISQEEIDASQKLADEMGIPLKVRIYS